MEMNRGKDLQRLRIHEKAYGLKVAASHFSMLDKHEGEEFVKQICGKCGKVYTWVVNDLQDIENMAKVGVYVIISDFPDRLDEVLGR